MLEKHLNPNNDTRIYTASEVTFDYSSKPVRVDYMRVFKSHIFCHNNRDALTIQDISALNSQERLKMKVNILGTDYDIVSGSKEQYPRLKVAAGYTDTSIKRIVILDCNTLENDDANIKDLVSYEKKVVLQI